MTENSSKPIERGLSRIALTWLMFPLALFPLVALLTYDGRAIEALNTPPVRSTNWIGALIAFERGISLRGYEDTGVSLNATFSRELVESIFTPPLPLHDGGMTIRAGRIAAAHCVFPVSNNRDLSCSGMRHRAAVGLSEETDALVVVVSEESGAVSVAHNGKLLKYTGEQRAQSLLRWISKAMPDTGSSSPLVDRLLKLLSKGLKK